MIVRVDETGVQLDSPEDCTRFHVEANGSAIDLGAALAKAGAGHLGSDGDARVLINAVRKLAQGRVSANWDEQFANMLSYAESKHWLDDGDTTIRAHIQRT